MADAGLNLSVAAKDSRYPINVTVGDADSFTVYFNPTDPFVMEYASNLGKLDAPEADLENPGAFLSFTDKIARNLDAIFGEGAARTICRYDGADHALLNALLEKVREGYEDFKEKAKKAEATARKEAEAKAKAEAAAFVASKS